MRQIILDTETTGLETELGHRIIEIGCIELVNRKFTGKKFHHYINPQRDIEAEALAVHGITQEFLRDKPTFEQIAEEFLEFIHSAELVIHNAPFDVGFIDYEMSLIAKKRKPLASICRITDTLIMARQLHVGQRNSLDALCKRYSVDNAQRDLHGALLDAHLLAQVYLAMTGGQGSLFEESKTQEQLKPVEISLEHESFQKRDLIILTASPEELAAHEAKLQAMAEKGKCLWATL